MHSHTTVRGISVCACHVLSHQGRTLIGRHEFNYRHKKRRCPNTGGNRDETVKKRLWQLSVTAGSGTKSHCLPTGWFFSCAVEVRTIIELEDEGASEINLRSVIEYAYIVLEVAKQEDGGLHRSWSICKDVYPLK